VAIEHGAMENAVVSIALVWFFARETKGKGLERI